MSRRGNDVNTQCIEEVIAKRNDKQDIQRSIGVITKREEWGKTAVPEMIKPWQMPGPGVINRTNTSILLTPPGAYLRHSLLIVALALSGVKP